MVTDDPTVLIDHQIFDQQRFGGSSRIFVALLARQEGRYRMEAGVEASRNIHALEAGLFQREPEASARFSEPRLKRTLRRILGDPPQVFKFDTLWQRNRGKSQRMAAEGDFDVILPTYYDPNILASKPANSSLVVTVLDLIPERFPEFFVGDVRHTVWKRRMVDAADHLVAISESTRCDLIDFWDVRPERITVAPLADSLGPVRPTDSPERVMAEPFLLYVGNRSSYKNFWFCLEAIAFLRGHLKDLRLLAVGPPPTDLESRHLRDRDWDTWVTFETGDDSFVRRAYRDAVCAVVPTLGEGFGLPVVEALAAGCPVAANGIPVLREIAGNEAFWFEGKNRRKIAETVEAAWKMGRGSEADVRRRMDRAGNFSWDQTADAYGVAFRAAIEGAQG